MPEKRLLHLAHAFGLRDVELKGQRGDIAHQWSRVLHAFPKAQKPIPVPFGNRGDLCCHRIACRAQHGQPFRQPVGQCLASQCGNHGLDPAVEDIEAQVHRRKPSGFVGQQIRIDVRQQNPVDG